MEAPVTLLLRLYGPLIFRKLIESACRAAPDFYRMEAGSFVKVNKMLLVK